MGLIVTHPLEELIANSDYFLTFENGEFKNQDFSGKKLQSLTSINSQFENCRFENMDVDNICFGEGRIISTYLNCSFDQSSFYSRLVGIARFVNCTFRHVNIMEFRAYHARFINCVFSGKLSNATFHGRVLKDGSGTFNSNTFDSDTNAFIGNDFSQIEMSLVVFRVGADLTQQKLPPGVNYLYTEQTDYFINQFKHEIKKLQDRWIKRIARRILMVCELDIELGQKQFFFNKKDMPAEIFDIIKQILNS